VGIDIGSSTSHLMFSKLTVGYPSHTQRRPEVLERRIVDRSPILLTPFTGDWNIDAEPLKKLIDAEFAAAGLSPEAVDTGAVIITGEAARRDNAQRIAEMFSDQAGKFVCATAGPRLEALMAAHGSGAVALSREFSMRVLHVDIGGGTTKVSMINRGRVLGSTAVNIGARIVAHDEARRVVRLEQSGDRFLRELGQTLSLGSTLDEAVKAELATYMAAVLFDAIDGKATPWPELWVLDPIHLMADIDGVLFSGGVSEYIYGREQIPFGDLGPLLGQEVRKQAQARAYKVFDAAEGIRATVIGASAYTIQLSGETIFMPRPEALPLHNLRTYTAHATWEAPVAEHAEESIRRVLDRRDPEELGSRYALVLATPPFLGYGVAQDLAEGIRRALAPMPPDDRPEMLVFEQNIGGVVGQALASDVCLPCIDEVSLSALDFIDVGTMVEGESYVPVVVKSLAFEF